MKKTILTGAVVLIAACGTAQKDVPAAVKTAFEKQYPAVKDVDWEKEGVNFEAEFEVNETETSVVFDAFGKLLETETEIAATELPKAVLDYLASNYNGQKIKEAAKITLADGTVHYEAEIKGKDLLFDANGNVISK